MNARTSQLSLPGNASATMVAFALIGGALLVIGRKDYPELHTILDTAMFLLSAVLALLFWDMGTRIQQPFPRWIGISFAVTSLLEFVHVVVTVEWSGSLVSIARAAEILRPATWPPAAYVLPVGIGCSVWLMRRGWRRVLDLALALTVLGVGLLILSGWLPRYASPGWLGITRPTLVLGPLLWALVGLACW